MPFALNFKLKRLEDDLRPEIPLTKLIDPATNDLSALGSGPLPNATWVASGLPASLFHLAVVARAWKMTPPAAVAAFMENPYLQYFCGFQHFQRKFPGNEKLFLTFCRKAEKSANSESLLFLPPRAPRHRTRSPARKRALLRKAVSDSHPLSIALELMPWEELEELRPPSVEPWCFRLALLRKPRMEVSRLRDAFLSSLYWQYFCGLKYFSNTMPKPLGRVALSLRKLESSPGWPKAKRTAEKIFAGTWSRRSPYVRLDAFLSTRIDPLISSVRRENLPLRIGLPGLSGSERMARIAKFFKARKWRTTLIGEDDLALAQQGLHGEFLRFIRFSDEPNRVWASFGLDGFADVVVEEENTGQPGKIEILTAGPRDLEGRLDHALVRARNLEQFLHDPRMLENYFASLSLAFPGHLEKRSFTAITKQLGEILPEIPELGARLWDLQSAETAPASILLQIDTPSYGRGFHTDEFRAYLERLGSRKGEWEPRNPGEIEAVVRETAEELFRIELGTLSESETRDTYARLRRSARTQGTASALLRSYLRSATFESIVRTGDSDTILRHFENPEKPALSALGEGGVVDAVGFWLSIMKPLLPTLSELLASAAFPVLRRETRRGKSIELERHTRESYELIPIRRKLHGIWRGIFWKDCVGGNATMLDQLMPERWATTALEGAKLYYAVFDGRIYGFCQVVPFEIAGARYGSIDTQWQELFVRRARGIGGQKAVFEVWLEEIRRRCPEGWRGFAVGSNPAGRDPFGSALLRELACYKLGRAIGTSKDVTFPDPLAARIVHVSEKNGYGSRYRGSYGSRMLTDASIGPNSPVFLLGATD